MIKGDIHIIGAGLSGLAAAVYLSDQSRRIFIHELSRNAGGRCRSYFDPILGMVIDNGNHLILSSNQHALSFVKTIDSVGLLSVPENAEFSFYDLDKRQKWKLQLNNSIFPWWSFSKSKRIPETSLSDYIKLVLFTLKCLKKDKQISEIKSTKNDVFTKLVSPVLLAALNTKPQEASSRLAGKILLKTLGKGGKGCKPLISRSGLGSVFIDPALKFLLKKNVEVKFNHQLKSLHFQDKSVSSLVFENQKIDLKKDDVVILAVPAWVAKILVPNLKTPTDFNPIVNLHYQIQVAENLPPIIAVLNGCSEWIFSFPGRLSVTISAAEHLIEVDREQLAKKVWEEIQVVTGLEMNLPPWQIVKERRATFKATPEQNSLRPLPLTSWKNLILAGDWTQTGYPATIEGAVLSGKKAADLVRFYTP